MALRPLTQATGLLTPRHGTTSAATFYTVIAEGGVASHQPKSKSQLLNGVHEALTKPVGLFSLLHHDSRHADRAIFGRHHVNLRPGLTTSRLARFDKHPVSFPLTCPVQLRRQAIDRLRIDCLFLTR